MRALALILFLCAVPLPAEDAGKIVRPTDGAALETGDVDIIATAPAGKLELDGKPVVAHNLSQTCCTRIQGEPRRSLANAPVGRREKGVTISSPVQIHPRALRRFTSIRRSPMCSAPNATK